MCQSKNSGTQYCLCIYCLLLNGSLHGFPYSPNKIKHCNKHIHICIVHGCDKRDIASQIELLCKMLMNSGCWEEGHMPYSIFHSLDYVIKTDGQNGKFVNQLAF